MDVPSRPSPQVAAGLAAHRSRTLRAHRERMLAESVHDEGPPLPDIAEAMGRGTETILTQLAGAMSPEEVWRDIWTMTGTNGHNTQCHLLMMVATSHGIWLSMHVEKVWKPSVLDGIPLTPIPYGAITTRRVSSSYVPKIKRLRDGRVELGTYKWWDPSPWLQEMHTTPVTGPLPRLVEQLGEAGLLHGRG